MWIGGDSAVLDGWSRTLLKGRKVFSLFDELLMGFAGEPRFAQIVRYGLPNMPKLERKHTDDPLDWLTMALLPAILELCQTHRFDWHDGDNASSAFLLGYLGTLYQVISPGSIAPIAGGIDALGAGASYAIGALDVSLCDGLPPEVAILQSLEVAGKYSAAVSPPYYVEML